MTHKEYANGLRAIADWIEAHPELDVPYEAEWSNFSLDEKEDAQKLIRALGKVEKRYDDGYLWITGNIAGFAIKAGFFREKVCVRKVVGKKIIPATIIPAREETIVPEREEEIIEWDCLPVMADTQTQSEQPA